MSFHNGLGLSIAASATPAFDEIPAMSTTSSPASSPPIKINAELYIILSRTRLTSKRPKLKKLFTFGSGKSRPIKHIVIEAILTSEVEVREFWKEHVGAHDQHERRKVGICYADGQQVMKLDDDGENVEATGVRIWDEEAKTVMDVWAQKVKYGGGMDIEML